MEMTAEIWVAACAHELQRRWRTIDPDQLEEVAIDIGRDTTLRDLPPAQAALQWLRPVTTITETTSVARGINNPCAATTK